jgi:hypothetical protein
MPYDEVIRLLAILSEVLVERRRRTGLNVADRSDEAVADREQSTVCLPVPCLIGYGSWFEKSDPDFVVSLTRRRSRTGDTKRPRQQC